MSQSWKPRGYNDVSVYVVAEGAARVMEFLKNVFDAEPLQRFAMPDGTIMHAELRVGDTVVMIAEAGGAYPAFPVWLHVYVPNAEGAYRKALEAGGEAVQAAVQKEHDPDRRGGFKDPAGNT